MTGQSLIVVPQPPTIIEDRGRTLADLIHAYLTDDVSSFHALRYEVRRNQANTLRRLEKQRGSARLADLKRRDFKLWHQEWCAIGLPTAQAYLKAIRRVVNFAADDLEDADCERLSGVLRRLKFNRPKPRKKFMTLDMIEDVRRVAHYFGWPSIALAQAIQFETGLRQKDIIGEWIPETEPGDSILTYRRRKWLRGLTWNEIDADLVLTHVTSKKGKDLEVDLNLAPMFLEELPHVIHRTVDGPIIINEITGLPWTANEFRRKWRICAREAGVPNDVFEMDTRSSAWTESDQAGAPLENIQEFATHSDSKQTRDYIRGSQRRKITDTQLKRIAYREQQRKEKNNVA